MHDKVITLVPGCQMLSSSFLSNKLEWKILQTIRFPGIFQSIITIPYSKDFKTQDNGKPWWSGKKNNNINYRGKHIQLFFLEYWFTKHVPHCSRNYLHGKLFSFFLNSPFSLLGDPYWQCCHTNVSFTRSLAPDFLQTSGRLTCLHFNWKLHCFWQSAYLNISWIQILANVRYRAPRLKIATRNFNQKTITFFNANRESYRVNS